jgi:hypothetical protein
MSRPRRGNSFLPLFAVVVVVLTATASFPTIIIFVDSSSSSGNNNNNAPFLVVSEITVRDDGDDDVSDGRDDTLENFDRDDIGGGGGDPPAVNAVSDDAAKDCERVLQVRDDGGIGASERGGGGGEVGGGGYSGESDTDDENYKGQEADDEYHAALEEGDMKDVGKITSSSSILSVLQPPPSFTNVPMNDKSTSDSTTASSQPLKTLKRLQAMLDDTDYATQSFASSSSSSSSLLSPSMMTPKSSISVADAFAKTNHENEDAEVKNAFAEVSGGGILPSAASSDLTSLGQPEKLWTSKDRARYRRTRRTEKQRQQDENARKLRDMERQRIILKERRREREFLLSLEMKEKEAPPRQQESNFDEAADVTDDETDDGYGHYGGVGGGGSSMGFELPNLPVYLSDGETEDEDDDGDRNFQQHQQQQRQQQGYHRPMQHNMASPTPPPPGVDVGAIIGQQSYNFPEVHQGQSQQPPPPHLSNKGTFQHYLQQYPNYLQHQAPPHQQQIMPLSLPYQYGHSPQQQQQQQQQRQTMMQQNQYVQYQEQYTAWAQAAAAAAANGYYYTTPPPPPPPLPHSSAQTTFQVAPQQPQEPLQYPYIANSHPQQQNQGPTSYAIGTAQHLQHLYHLQQQQQQHGDGGGGGPSSYSNIPPLQHGAPLYHPHLPPPLLRQSELQQQASGYYQDGSSSSAEQQLHHQGEVYNRNRGWSGKRSFSQSHQQQQQQQQLQNYYDGGTRYQTSMAPTPTVGNALPSKAAANLSEMSTTETNNNAMPIIGGRTRMGVESAFISPRLASISSASSGSSGGTAVASTVLATAEAPFIKIGEDSIEQFIDDECEQDVLIAGANTKITFDSVQKVMFATVSMALLSYCAVSPRSLPFPEYNRLFLQNLSTVAIGTIAPILTFLCVFDGRYNNINTAVSCQTNHSMTRLFFSLILPRRALSHSLFSLISNKL